VKRQQPQAAESTPTDDSLLPLPAIRGSVPDILRQPLRRPSSLRYLVTCSHQKVTLGTGNYKGPGFWISAPACRKTGGRRSTPSPSHQQARWAPDHSLVVTTLRSAAFSRLHTRTRSEVVALDLAPFQLLQSSARLPSTCSRLKTCCALRTPPRYVLHALPFLIIHTPCILVDESHLCAMSIPEPT